MLGFEYMHINSSLMITASHRLHDCVKGGGQGHCPHHCRGMVHTLAVFSQSHLIAFCVQVTGETQVTNSFQFQFATTHSSTTVVEDTLEYVPHVTGLS